MRKLDYFSNFWLWGQVTRQELFGCKILFFTPSSEHALTHFYSSQQIYMIYRLIFHSIDFSAVRRLVWNTKYIQVITFEGCVIEKCSKLTIYVINLV